MGRRRPADARVACAVRVLADLLHDALPDPEAVEWRMLERVRARRVSTRVLSMR